MDMKNINVFRRLDELETANLHLQVMLKSVRMELEALRSGVTILHNAVQWLDAAEPEAVKPKAVKPKAVKTKAALESTRAKKAAYARKYYAQKRAAAKAAA